MYSVKISNELLDAHECEALVLTCMDFRFHEATKKFVRDELNIPNFDMITVPGGCKGVAERNGLGKHVSDVVALSQQLHKIKKVIIVNHGTCGAYGIPDSRQELATQTEDLKRADALLGDLFPDLSFQLFFAQNTSTSSAQGGDGEITYVPVC